ncbi:MAG: DUF899 domain-containing protein [Actinobacteria bacterium]|nr:DUF899 domain-containing protein [Actinomycetota bacterium]
MAEHTTGTREEWLAAREKLLEREQELSRLGDELAEERRKLPWVRVEKEYTLDTDEGPKTLAELFDGRSQLLVYHLMFGPDWTAACPSCSSLADHFDGMLAHLNARDVTLTGVSHAPLEKLRAYKQRLGWTFPYVSSFESDFNFDFGVSFTEEQRKEFADEVLEEFADNDAIAEAAASCGTDLAGYVTTEGPGLSAFALEEGVVYQTYFAGPPKSDSALGFLMFYEQLLARTPKGGKEGVPTRRHDEYEDGAAGATG